MSHMELDCAAADELAGAYALGALESAQDRAMSAHLAGCPNPHVEARELIGSGALLAHAVEPVTPSPGLRDRLMETIAATPQDHRTASLRTVEPAPTRRPVLTEPRNPWWRLAPLPSALAAVGLAAAVGLGAWGASVNSQLAERDAALRAVASADVIHAASGTAGSGWVFETGGVAMFMAEDLADLPQDRLYELWIIDADGNPLPAGILTETEGVTLVSLERGLEGASAFAITVESEPVDAPTSDPVIVAPLGT